jgi:hypothetical protein
MRMKAMDYDVIGDVHGQDGKLTALLGELGYRKRLGAYRRPKGRSAIFVGDLIDRGPGQVAVVDLVRRMEKAAAPGWSWATTSSTPSATRPGPRMAPAGYAAATPRTMPGTRRSSPKSAGTRHCTASWSRDSGRFRVQLVISSWSEMG